MPESDTPFIRMLKEYMWRVRTPPINPNKLASELGIARTTVANWLNGTKPVPEIVPTLAAKMGVPVEGVMRALDYPVVRDSAMSQAFDDLEDWASTNAALSAAQRRTLLSEIEDLRKRYETSASQTPHSESDDDAHPKARAALAR